MREDEESAKAKLWQRLGANRPRTDAITYETRFDPSFEESFARAHSVLRLARNMAAAEIAGAESRNHIALSLTQNFNAFVADLKQVLASPTLGVLPAVTHNGVPIGATKVFACHGWMTTIILNVPEKRALLVGLEPEDQTRSMINMLTNGQIGP